MVHKLYSIVVVLSVFTFAGLFLSIAGIGPAALRADEALSSTKACEIARQALSDPESNTWKARLDSWLCFPELIDPE